MIGIPLGLAYSNAMEWVVHKHILHGRRLGKKRGTFWSFHFHDHHRNARQQGFRDADYEGTVLQWNGQGKEALALSLSTLAHLPLLPVAPFFTATVVYSAARYYRLHRRSHLDPAWGREHLPWHYDHHMAPDQDCNWCVTHPWFDTVMGTRVPYKDTPREAADLARRARTKASTATAAEPAPREAAHG